MFYVYLITATHTALKTYETEEGVHEEVPKIMAKFEEMMPGQVLHVITALQELSEEELNMVIAQGIQAEQMGEYTHGTAKYFEAPETVH